jgi:hypothetical protein
VSPHPLENTAAKGFDLERKTEKQYPALFCIRRSRDPRVTLLSKSSATALALALTCTVPAWLGAAPGAKASEGPQPTPMPPPIAAPQDIPYPGGPITLSVDATDIGRRIFQVHETIPVAKAGPLVLLFPQWLPGNHSPSGQLDKFAGLIIRAGGQRIEWVRDPVNVFAFHIDAPAGPLELEFQYVSPVTQSEGRVQPSIRPAISRVTSPSSRLSNCPPAGVTARLWSPQARPSMERRPSSRPPSIPWSIPRCSPAAISNGSTWIPAARRLCIWT